MILTHSYDNTGVTGPCEMSGGWGTDGVGQPVVKLCGKPGLWRDAVIRPFGVIVCEDCWEQMDPARHKGANP